MQTEPIPRIPPARENGPGGATPTDGGAPGRLKTLSRSVSDTLSELGPERFTNRELSWLEFGARLLDLAEDERVPLLERVKFLAIFSEGLDEFFQVRVAGLKDQVDAGLRARSADGLRPSEALRAIGARVSALVARQSHIFVDEIAPELAAAGIRLSDWSSLDHDDRDYLVDVFQRQIFPVLTPLSVDPGHPFPYISNLSLNLIVRVGDPVTGEERVARVKVPPLLPRFVVMPDGERFVALEQIIAAHLATLFPDMVIGEHYAFRVTRNADLALEEDEADDLHLDGDASAVLFASRWRLTWRPTPATCSSTSSTSVPRISTRRPPPSTSADCGPSTPSTGPSCRRRRGHP